MNRIGERLKAARKLSGKKQDEVSAALGLGAGVLTAYENNKSGISDERITQLATFYGVDPSWLAGRSISSNRDDAFYDGILHALAVYNRASGELIAEVQAWRGKRPPTVTPDDLQAADDGIRARKELEAKINQAKRNDGSTKAG